MTDEKTDSIKRVAQHLITLTLAGSLILPSASVFSPGWVITETELWVKVYVWSDVTLLLIYAPIYMSWLFFLLTKSGRIKKAVKRIMLVLSIIVFLNALAGITMPIQDYSPELGLVCSIVLTPLLILLFFSTDKLENNTLKIRFTW